MFTSNQSIIPIEGTQQEKNTCDQSLSMIGFLSNKFFVFTLTHKTTKRFYFSDESNKNKPRGFLKSDASGWRQTGRMIKRTWGETERLSKNEGGHENDENKRAFVYQSAGQDTERPQAKSSRRSMFSLGTLRLKAILQRLVVFFISFR